MHRLIPMSDLKITVAGRRFFPTADTASSSLRQALEAARGAALMLPAGAKM
jgi:hypothetical protein